MWHAVTVTFSGPATGEDATPNPFRDYRLNVTFSHAASRSELHRARLLRRRRQTRPRRPPRRATSGASTSRRTARASGATALRSGPAATSPSAWNPAQERQRLSTAHPALSGCRAPTRKRPTSAPRDCSSTSGAHYLRHAGSGEYYLKGGADSPENFLAYADFDRHLRHRCGLRQLPGGRESSCTSTRRTRRTGVPAIRPGRRQGQGHHRRPQLPRRKGHEQRLLPDLQPRRRRRPRHLDVDRPERQGPLRRRASSTSGTSSSITWTGSVSCCTW